MESIVKLLIIYDYKNSCDFSSVCLFDGQMDGSKLAVWFLQTCYKFVAQKFGGLHALLLSMFVEQNHDPDRRHIVPIFTKNLK